MPTWLLVGRGSWSAAGRRSQLPAGRGQEASLIPGTGERLQRRGSLQQSKRAEKATETKVTDFCDLTAEIG